MKSEERIRTGVYGIIREKNKLLLVKQKSGPYKDKFDLPGGQIEFRETIEQALTREFEEELNCCFSSIKFWKNVTVILNDFYQIGLVYLISGLRSLNKNQGLLESQWIEIDQLNSSNASSLLLTAIKTEKDDTIQIKLAEKKDIPLLIKKFPISFCEETVESKWKRYLEEQKQQIRKLYIVSNKEEIIGYGSLLYVSENPFFRERNLPEIHDVWVEEKMRGNRIGRKLITFLEDKAREEGFGEVGLGVGLYKDYGRAQRLYAKLEYIPDGNGITYDGKLVVPGESYRIDDDCILWLTKVLI